MRARGGVQAPSPPQAPDGGGGGGWVWLVTARGIIEAQLIRGVVEAAGIGPVVFDQRDPSPGAWMFLSGNVNALIRILVPSSMLEGARLALLESGLDTPAAEVEPADGSFEPRRWLIVAMVALAVVAIVLVASLRGVVAR